MILERPQAVKKHVAKQCTEKQNWNEMKKKTKLSYHAGYKQGHGYIWREAQRQAVQNRIKLNSR
jgi:hypothetical protein